MAIVDKRGTDGFPAAINDIPSAALTQGGNEVHMYPGTYTAPTDVVASDYAYIGQGDAEEIIINGDMSFADGSTGQITFKNITFNGSSATAAGGTSCVSKLGNTAVTLKFENCIFKNSDIGVNQLANVQQHAAAGFRERHSQRRRARPQRSKKERWSEPRSSGAATPSSAKVHWATPSSSSACLRARK